MSRLLTWWRSLPLWARALVLVAAIGLAAAVAVRLWEVVCAALLALTGLAVRRPASGDRGPASSQVATTAAGEARRAAERVTTAAAQLADERDELAEADRETDRAMARAADLAREAAEARPAGEPAPSSTFLDRLSRRPGGSP